MDSRRIFVLLTVMSAVLADPQCDTPCSRLYMPVCGADGKTYSNFCMFRNAQCRNPDLKQHHVGQCSGVGWSLRPGLECVRICPRALEPVCGSNGQTYSSVCALQNANCGSTGEFISMSHIGPCESHPLQITNSDLEAGQSCARRCPFNYEPVCGSDGVTYGNKCMFEEANCILGDTLTLAQQGRCHGQAESEPTLTDNASVGTRQCALPCSRQYLPVCDMDGKTHPNLCEFRNAQCRAGGVLRLDYEGRCREQHDLTQCEQPCPRQYLPVCDTAGRSYSNLCEFRNAQCRDSDLKQHMGPCPITSSIRHRFLCMRVCPLEQTPVCGSDGHTYSTLCELQNANCGVSSGVKLAYEGRCNNQSESQPSPSDDESSPVEPEPSPSDEESSPAVSESSPSDNESPRAVRGSSQHGPLATRDGAVSQQTVSESPQPETLPPKSTPDNCPTTCTMIYDPVCASDGRTYPNKCSMEVANCRSNSGSSTSGKLKLVYHGRCVSSVAQAPKLHGCDTACPRIRIPVCGSDEKTYANTCIFNIANCKAGGSLTIIGDRACPAY